jgi:hypothetical protein
VFEVLAAGVVVATAAPAAAHGVGGLEPTNYLMTVDSVRPAIEGITVTAVDLGTRLQLNNATAHDVVVFGYDGEPYLRVGPRGVFHNVRSPATYLNRSLTLSDAPLPPRADPTAAPEWGRISGGDTVRWHDHRAHYMGTSDPPVVQRDPSQRHVIDRYTVKMRWRGDDVVARGRLVWVPPPSPWPYVAAAIVLAVAVVLGSRTRAWPAVLAVALVVLVVAETLHVIGLYDASTDSLAEKGFQSLYSVAGILLALVALGWTRRRGAESAMPLVLLAGIFLFVAGGLADVTSLAKALVPSTFSAAFARVLVAVTLGVGAGTAIAAAWRLAPARHAPATQGRPASGSTPTS